MNFVDNSPESSFNFEQYQDSNSSESSESEPKYANPAEVASNIKKVEGEIKDSQTRIKELQGRLQDINQEKEIYNHESQIVLEKMKDANWEFTKDSALALSKVKKPPKELQEIAEKFMMMLGERETGWDMFEACLKNHNSLKALMNNFSPEKITETMFDSLMELWKNKAYIYPEIAKQPKGGTILFDWITSCFEYKIKKSTLDTTERTYNDVNNQIKSMKNEIELKTSRITELEKSKFEVEKKKNNTIGATGGTREKKEENTLAHETARIEGEDDGNSGPAANFNILDSLPKENYQHPLMKAESTAALRNEGSSTGGGMIYQKSTATAENKIDERRGAAEQRNVLPQEISKTTEDTVLNVSSEVKPGQEVNPILKASYYFPPTLGSPKEYNLNEQRREETLKNKKNGSVAPPPKLFTMPESPPSSGSDVFSLKPEYNNNNNIPEYSETSKTLSTSESEPKFYTMTCGSSTSYNPLESRRVSKIYNIIEAHDERNHNNVVMHSDKLYFTKEKEEKKKSTTTYGIIGAGTKKLKSAEETQNLINIINENRKMMGGGGGGTARVTSAGTQETLSSRINTMKSDGSIPQFEKGCVQSPWKFEEQRNDLAAKIINLGGDEDAALSGKTTPDMMAFAYNNN